MSTFLEKSFNDVERQLKKQFNCKLYGAQKKEFQKLHKRIFCFSNLVFHLCKLVENETGFLNELHSDLVLLLVSSILGMKKYAALSSRNCIEDVLRHVYFEHHPIEFIILNESGENRFNVEQSFNYLKDHPTYKKLKGFDNIFGYLKDQYSQQSKLIHATSIRDFQLHKSISQIQISNEGLSKMVNEIIKLIDSLITVIIIFHKQNFYKIHHDHRNLILSCVSNTNKKVIHQI